MPLTAQDMLHGVDFTGLASGDAASHNQLVDQATPVQDDVGLGKGINLWTIDSGLGVPVVPNPNSSAPFNKWVRYIWVRIPFAGATVKTPLVYGWNSDAPVDATFLQWLPITDTASLQAQINTALANSASAQTVANNANTVAGTAATQAANAVTTANAANTTAATASAAAAQAELDAGTAQNTANAALATANNAALPAAVATRILPGSAGQELRTNSGGSAPEWFSRINTYIKATEVQNKGTDAGASAGGKNTRILNNLDNNSGGLGALAAGLITLNEAGTYYVKAFACCSDDSLNPHQLLVVSNATNVTLLTGRSVYFRPGGVSDDSYAEVSGILTIAAGQVIRLDHYITNGKAVYGLGKAANIHPDAGGKEVYASIELWKIGA